MPVEKQHSESLIVDKQQTLVSVLGIDQDLIEQLINGSMSRDETERDESGLMLEPSESKRQPRTLVSVLGIDQDLIEQLAADIKKEPIEKKSQPERRSKERAPSRLKGIRKFIGAVAVGFTAASALVASGILSDEKAPPVSTSDKKEESLFDVSTVETTTTMDALVPDTAPPISEATPPFSVSPGELIGVLKVPAICEEIQVLSYSEQEIIDDLIGSGRGTLDKTDDSDPTPNTTCETLEEREKERESTTGSEYISRIERSGRVSAMKIPENPEGYVRYWQPIAGHRQRTDGVATSVYPGQSGNSVIAGHGSTFSAPFADFGLLKPGDQAIFTREDGKIFIFEVDKTEILGDDRLTPILDYKHPANPATLTTFLCSDRHGNTGNDEKRLAVRWVLTDSR